MSDGKTHDKVTQYISVAAPIVVGLVYFSDERLIAMTCLAFSGCQLQRYCSPDTDVNHGFYGLYIAKRDFGIYLGYIWDIIIFALRIVPHRHWLSHGPVVGTFIRLSYLYLVFYLITRFAPEYFIYITLENIEYFAIFSIGFLMGDLGHLWFDYVWRL